VTATGKSEKLLSAVTCIRQANNQSHDAVNRVRKSIQRVQLALLSQESPKLTAHFYGKYFGAICREVSILNDPWRALCERPETESAIFA
jgi:hypothetical protein